MKVRKFVTLAWPQKGDEETETGKRKSPFLTLKPMALTSSQIEIGLFVVADLHASP